MTDFLDSKDPRFKVFEKPSCLAVAGTKVFEPCIAPRDKFCGAIITGLCSVTPLTNITPLDLNYQLYLNYIFHRENLSFYTHATTMPLIVLFYLSTAAQLKFVSGELYQWIDLSFVLVSCLFIWYMIWGIKSRIYWMGPCSLPILASIYVGAHYYQEYAAATIHPMIWAGVFGSIQSWSHIVEDMPPRVDGTPHWTRKRDFFCREVTNVCEILERAIRALLQAFVFGTLDELIASPRLLPLFWSICPVYKILRVLNINCSSKIYLDKLYADYARTLVPQKRLEIRSDNLGNLYAQPLPPVKLSWIGKILNFFAHLCSCCCMEHGPDDELPDPALDFIGTGGGVYLRSNYSIWELLCCPNFTKEHFEFLYRAAVQNQCKLLETDINNFNVTTSPTSNEDLIDV